MRNNIIKYLITVLSGLSLLMAGSCNNDTDWENYVYPPAEDKSALQSLIDECNILADNAKIGNLEGEYQPHIVENFNAEINAAKKVLDNDKATQMMVDTAVSKLDAAKKLFEDSRNLYDLDENDDALVLMLRMNGNVVDSSPFSHEIALHKGNAACGNGPEPSLTTDRNGEENRAIHMEKGAYISVPFVEGKSEALNPKVMTFMCWIREPNPAPGERWIFCLDTWNINMFYIQQSQTELMFNYCSDKGWGTATPSSIHTSKDWQHVAVTYSPDGIRFYCNGELKSYSESNHGYLNEDLAHQPFMIGNMSADASDRYFQGDLDEIRLYGIVLSDEDIKQIYDLEKPE